MKILFVGWYYADAAGLHAAHQKDLLCSSSHATDVKHRGEDSRIAGSKISPSILLSGTSNFTASNERCHYRSRLAILRHRGEVPFFRGWSRPSDREVKPIPHVSAARCILAMLPDTISDVNRLKGRTGNNAQSRDQLGPMQSRSAERCSANDRQVSSGSALYQTFQKQKR